MNFTDRRLIALSHDIVMVVLAWIAAYAVHQNLEMIPNTTLLHAVSLIPIVLFIQVPFFIFFGLYRGMWRFASLPDLMRIVKSIVCGVVTLLVFCNFFFSHPYNLPRSIPLLHAIFLLLFLSFGRMVVRWHKDFGNLPSGQSVKRALIIGSDNQAESVIREMLRDVMSPYRPVAIVDSDSSTRHREIHGVRVVGTFTDILSVVRQYEIEIIIIALSEVSAKDMTIILQDCNAAEVPYKIISSFHEKMINNRLLSSLREVNLEDLLGRETYQIDIALFHRIIRNKTVLVTGGGGSIGSELCRQIASLNPSELLIIDHSEENLYRIDFELREKFPQLNLKIALLSILNLSTLEVFFAKHQPHYVFHAAAYKHVPILESQLLIAVSNNVIGSKNVADMAVKYHAEALVQVSTDKAVNPSSIMGLTKRIAEIYCQALVHTGKTKMITVRFGNVLGSAGSVVPLFNAQLQRGGPLTVTHPDMTRYFMTIPEACRLILQAMTMGVGGEIFVLDMGQPVKIKALAEQMIRLSGKKVEEDIKIIYTGLRAGEKLQEELFYQTEMLMQTQHKKIFCSESSHYNRQKIQQDIDEIVLCCYQQDEKNMLEKIVKLVPEYQRQHENKLETADIA